MITLIGLAYVGLVYVAFKVIRLKVNPRSVAVSVVIGVLLLGGIVITWRMAAPISKQITVKRDVIQLLSGQDSKELITKIHVEQEQPVKKGDVLYEVDPAPSQYAVDQLTAQLAVSREKVSELEAGVEVATASVRKAQAAQEYQKAALDTAVGIQRDNPQAIAQLKVTVQEQTYKSAQAALEQALATEKEANFALASAREAIKATEAQLAIARLNLEQCAVRAPADGYMMNWQAVEGTMTTTVISSAQGTFMDMTSTVIAAVYPQNLLKNVAEGDTVELAFRNMPGEIATGKVASVIEYTGEGQLMTGSQLPVAATLGSKGFLVVRIELDDEDLAKALPLGGAGAVAIYTKFGKPFHVISRITIRISSWMNYLPF